VGITLVPNRIVNEARDRGEISIETIITGRLERRGVAAGANEDQSPTNVGAASSGSLEER
jgi:hypothetical protein